MTKQPALLLIETPVVQCFMWSYSQLAYPFRAVNDKRPISLPLCRSNNSIPIFGNARTAELASVSEGKRGRRTSVFNLQTGTKSTQPRN